MIDAVQAASWQDVLTATPSGVARLYGYQLWTDENDGHGIVRKDGTERPACDVLRASLTRA